MAKKEKRNMFQTLFLKTLHDKRGFTIGWSIGLAVMAAITVAFFPTIKDQIGALFANVPKALESVTGTPDDYKTITNYIATGVFDLRIPMMTIVMAIILALSLSSSEEASGKLYQILAQPLSRSKILLEKWLAMLSIFAVTHIALFFGILLTVVGIGEQIALSKLFIGTFLCFMLTAAVGSITLALGFGLAVRGFATMIVSVYVFGGYLITSFAAQVEWVKKIDSISIFHYYKASEAMKHGYSFRNILVLLGIALVSVLVGLYVFQKRDVGTKNA